MCLIKIAYPNIIRYGHISFCVCHFDIFFWVLHKFTITNQNSVPIVLAIMIAIYRTMFFQIIILPELFNYSAIIDINNINYCAATRTRGLPAINGIFHLWQNNAKQTISGVTITII